ncbi:MAG: hypothetical protein HYV95_09360 [Opitutae bacterium]|nr:hypothetical protein [Opitutae bacterium]
MNLLKNKYLALLGLLLAMFANAHAALVAYDDATGAVTFTPGDLVGKVVLAIVAAVSAALAIGIISMGVRWIYRMARGAK